MKRDRLLRGVSVSLLLLPFCGYLATAAATEDLTATPGPPRNEDAEAIATALSGWLPDRLGERSVPGAAVVVVTNDTVVSEETYGVTNDPGSPRITPDTIFCIRSISKSVTALGVLLAVQEGLVDLDTPISDYLAGFSIHSRFDEHPERLMTLRQMLSHWASFTHDPPAGIDLGRARYFERYIERISETWLRFPVGYRHHYSNYGVDLAGYILQVRSGRSFADYMKEKVLDPVGMNSSSFDLARVEQRKNRAIGHDTQGRVVSVSLPEIPAAGLYASIRDMSRYMQFHLNDGVVDGRRLLRKDLMEQYHAIQFPHRDQRIGYTLGLWREGVSDTFDLHHEGGGRGFGSHMIVYPELGVGAAILTNREYHGLTGFEGRRIVNGAIINRHGPLPVADPGLDRMRKLDVDDPRVKAILGRYGDSPGWVIGFENGVLGLRRSDDSFAPLTFFDDGGQLVGMHGGTGEIRFLAPFGKRPGSMMHFSRSVGNSNCHYLDFNDSSLDPPGPANPDWRRYVGEYDVLWEDEPGSTAAVSIRNGYLYYRDGKCEEHEPGLFFLYDGEAIDFRSTPPTFATQEIRRRDRKGDYLGQNAPDTTPIAFAPDILSRSKPEWAYCAVFSPDHRELYYTRFDSERGIDQIIVMRMVDDTWSRPAVASFNSDESANDARISTDGKTLFFRSQRPLPGHDAPEANFYTWVVNRSGEGWGEPRPLELGGAPRRVGYLGVAKNGTLYFAYRDEDTIGGSDIYRARLRNGVYGAPEHLGPSVNTRYSEGDVFVAPDESYLIVTTWDRPDGDGGSDLYISFRNDDGSWGEQRNIGRPVNTGNNEGCPALSPDGDFFFYLSVNDNGDASSCSTFWVDAGVIDSLWPGD